MTDNQIKLLLYSLGIILIIWVAWKFLKFFVEIAWKGLCDMFHRYNPILVIGYIFFLFPIAACHIMILGWLDESDDIAIECKVMKIIT